VIGEDAHVGAGTQIGAHSVIGAGCWIGENCRIHPRVTLYGGVRLGNRVEIHSGAVIGADGFGYALGEGKHWKFPQVGIVEIGDDVEIGANATIDRGSLEDTRIAEGVKLDNLVHVGHNCQIGAHSVIAAQAGLSGSCVFGKRVVVGGQAGFGERCKLEDGSVIGGPKRRARRENHSQRLRRYGEPRLVRWRNSKSFSRGTAGSRNWPRASKE